MALPCLALSLVYSSCPKKLLKEWWTSNRIEGIITSLSCHISSFVLETGTGVQLSECIIPFFRVPFGQASGQQLHFVPAALPLVLTYNVYESCCVMYYLGGDKVVWEWPCQNYKIISFLNCQGIYTINVSDLPFLGVSSSPIVVIICSLVCRFTISSNI